MKSLLILALVSLLIFSSCSNNNPVTPQNAPAVPTLLSPNDASTGIPVSPTLKWNSAADAVSYKLQVSENSSFTTFLYNQSGLTTTSQLVSGLTPLSIYYWRVSAVNSKGVSDWSSVWSFTTTGPSPAAPLLTTPANNAAIYSAPVSLSWIVTSGALTYTLQVSSSSSFSTFQYNQSGITSFSQQVTGLTASTYYWRVSASNEYGTSAWSEIRSFTTNKPTEPFLSTPANGATNQPLNTSLFWSASSGATSFTLQVSLNSSFTSFIYNQSGLTSLTQQLTGLSGLTHYYWRVSASNDYGTSGWSSTWSFITQ